jgi:hypothetical protein
MNELEALCKLIFSVPDEIWEEWEKEAEKLEVTMDYYIMEFV